MLAKPAGLDDLRLWLYHRFVLLPHEAAPWPRWVVRSFGPPLRWLAARCRVSDPSSPLAWLRQLLLAEPAMAPARAAASLLRGPPPPLAQLLRGWLHPYLQPLALRSSAAIDLAGLALGRRYAALDAAGRACFAVAATGALALVASTPLEPGPQFVTFLLLLATAFAVRGLAAPTATVLLISISLLATSRYMYWRVTMTLGSASGLEGWLAIGLLVAEVYTWVVLLLGYLQNVQPLRRPLAALPARRADWPSVDVFIPTYNEPLAVVKPALLAALQLDWPADRLTVYLLDDGRRPEFRELALAVGARYVTRPDNRAAKAGNLNHALTVSRGELVAVFDCDHIPVASFLTATVGWFLKDPRCALVQTPHHFFSPDPFERNLGTFRRVPSEGSLFYGLVQDGNDLWDAAYFCGSCAVLRRAPLLEIGGVATDTVTEDAHTALRLHRAGYGSAYLRRILAAGLATENLASHIGQRIRWARGMAQIFRTDNPLLGKGLTLQQRLCYLNAMLHFFSGVPRLVFLSAPLAYLFFEYHVITAATVMLAAYAVPHLVLAAIANSHMQGRFRHSLWNEAYESALSWYTALPTLAALIAPRLGRFNVTQKGGLIEKPFFDWRVAAPYLALVALNLAGAVIAVPRMIFWNSFEAGTVAVNLGWTLFNLALLGTVLGVATETRQVRSAARVAKKLPARLHLRDGTVVACATADFSFGGVRLALSASERLAVGDIVGVELDGAPGAPVFAARAIAVDPDDTRLSLLPMSLADEQRYIGATFARPDIWDDWNAATPADRPLASLAEVLSFGMAGYVRLFDLLLRSLRARLGHPVALGHRARA